MEIKNAFEYIAGKVEAQLAPAGYTRQKVAADDKQEIVALFTSENVAYSVVYYKEKTHMVLRTCTMTEEGPDNEWKTLATWMLDEESTQKDVESISNDSRAFRALLPLSVQSRLSRKRKRTMTAMRIQSSLQSAL